MDLLAIYAARHPSTDIVDGDIGTDEPY